MQTLCVLLRKPRLLIRELGIGRSLAVVMLLAGGVLGPLTWPIFTTLLFIDIYQDRLFDFTNIGASVISLLWSGTALLGVVMAFVPLILGARRCKITHLLIWLPLVPIFYLLLFVAAAMGLRDLFARPHYWDKTSHGHALQKRPESPPFG